MHLTLLALALCAVGQESELERPAALRAMQESRQSLFSGSVHWSIERQWPGLDRRLQYSSRYAANGDRTFEERGDQDGWVTWSGTPAEPLSKFPKKYLQNEDGTWQYDEDRMVVHWWKSGVSGDAASASPPPGPDRFLDVRNVGIYTRLTPTLEYGAECLWSEPGKSSLAVRWDEVERDGMFEVTRHAADGSTVTWWIDPARGWNADRIVQRSPDGADELVTTCHLKQFGEVWFPEEIESRSGDKLLERVYVADASFNQPDDPVSISTADFGVEPGFNVVPQNFRSDVPGNALIWDGQAPVDVFAFKKRVEAGEVSPGPTVQSHARGEPSRYLTAEQRRDQERFHKEMEFRATQRQPLSEWERYVRDFIQTYQLNDEQQQARRILVECQQQGSQYLHRRKSAFYDVQDDVAEARKAGDQDALRRHYAILGELRTPIHEIFEQRLKPRLDRLPTRQQRAQVDQANVAKENSSDDSKD